MFITQPRYFLFLISCLISSIAFGQRESVQLANEYYRMGEVDKARSMYESLAKHNRNIPLIHQKYLNVLLDLNEFKEASKYINKALKAYPDNINYQIDKGLVIQRSGNETATRNYFYKLIEIISADQYQSRRAVQYMLRLQLVDYAILTLESTRAKSGDPFLFAIDLANIYRLQNNKQKMVEEYLNFAIQNPRNIQYIKNTFQVLLTEPEDLEGLERMLFELVQTNPGNDIYAEMLIWVSLQQKNFYGAFIQARAIDKRLQTGGAKVLNVGVIALSNKDYTNSIMIFDYLVNNYPNTNIAIQAQLYRIRARENLVKIAYPVDLNEVSKLIGEYNNFINSYASNFSATQAKLNKARLFAYYLNRNDSAISIIQDLIKSPRTNQHLIAEAKLDLADIYLLDDQPWESALLYAQVDKAMKETALGYEAKLRNAKLAFYRGNFQLAQEYLDILKLATSREIANDALELSIFIQSNTALDTSTVALSRYADIKLLLYQHKTTSALAEIESMLVDLPGHDLTDDLLYLKADIKKQEGEFLEATIILYLIVQDYGKGLLGDKSYFELAMIYEKNIKDKEKALELYNDFLKKYPGSIYTTEARKRFRVLRGDDNYVEAPTEVN
jgi:outer membrane protein assembly factor BamD (BamD/ComL family)